LRGQTAIEFMLIFGVIMVTIIVLFHPILTNQRDTIVTSTFKEIASDACYYINLGVKVEDYEHEPLNNLVGNVKCNFLGISVDSTTGEIRVTLKFEVNGNAQDFASGIIEYIKRRITEIRGFTITDKGEIFYRDSKITIEILT